MSRQVFKKTIDGTDYVASLYIEDETKCGICFEDFIGKSKINTLCGHRFCLKCFLSWVLVDTRKNIKCMMCRTSLATDIPASSSTVNIKHINKVLDLVNVRMTLQEYANYEEYRTLPIPTLLRQNGVIWFDDVIENLSTSSTQE